MKANEDKHIEKLVDHMMKDTHLETPSFDFTSKVMVQVLTTKTSNVTIYKPLISKKAMITVGSVLLALIVYSFFYDSVHSSKWTIPHIDFIPFNNTTMPFQFSKATTYSVVLTTIMLFIQIPLLKNYFNRKFEE
ncbi:hypothetical protein [Flavobacterium sp.]|uniref:hypothetical protein n=1 Tax=Flavobacterium sp. TaxID=239 RepID=UPI002634C19D|nr:hypothetical protein [Flavobacterium sp.]